MTKQDICFTELLICKNWHVKMEDHSNGIMDMEKRHLSLDLIFEVREMAKKLESPFRMSSSQCNGDGCLIMPLNNKQTFGVFTNK